MFQDLKENLRDTDESIHAYVEQTREYYELKVFKILMHLIDRILGWFIVSALLFLALLLFSIAVSYGLGVVFDSMVLGFVVVGLFYVLLIGLYALLRDKLSSPLIKRFSIYYFD
ncbi:hypothetical protein J4E06_15500 [Muricauda sp. NFXS6]|uniref:hypothetical protein n=1 Tax=Allomuricauda sp. NFXS6 TaxID=2819094 RepID=UPI0032DFC1D4